MNLNGSEIPTYQILREGGGIDTVALALSDSASGVLFKFVFRWKVRKVIGGCAGCEGIIGRIPRGTLFDSE